MENQKKIGIDARFFGPKDKGFGRYVQNLVLNLEKKDSHNLYFIFLNKLRDNDYVPKNKNFKKILVSHNCLWPIKLDKKLRQGRLDIMHFTCLPCPIFYKNNAETVFTVHDLIWKNFPPFKNILKKIFYGLAYFHAMKTAKQIIVNSEYVKNDILRFYEINPEKIKVIYEGIS